MILKYLYLAIAVVTFGSYIYSVTGFFRPEKEVMTRDYQILRLASVITWALSLRAIYFFDLELNGLFPLYVGIVCISLSLLFFWYTARHIGRHSFSIVFSKDTPKHHVSDGPYSYVRHPFYTGYILNYYSLALCMFSVEALVCAIVMNLIYYRAAKIEEDKFLSSVHKESYHLYQTKTGMLIPRVDRLFS